uniref:F-box domain-containing protein n=1 Tax=Cuerna arida TaxID=1464854 RepID=A0A1B6F2E5_9HEMI
MTENAPTTTICALPDEILHQIFSNLDAREIITVIVEVCNRWKYIVETDLLFWNNLQVVIDCDWFLDWGFFGQPLLHQHKETVGIYVGEKDLTKVSKVRCIKLEAGSRSGGIPSQTIIYIFEKIKKVCRHIIKVECSNCFGATSKSFIKLLNDSYNISELKFGVTAVWRIPYEEISNFRNLTTLITNDYGFKRTDLSLIANGCDKLESFWILFSRSIKNDDIICFLESKKETIKELGIGFPVTDISLAKIKECKKLTVLFISDARCITEKGIECLTDLPNLKYISLHRLQVLPEHLKDWVLSSSIPKQLTLLDLSEYYFIEPCQIHQIITKVCPVTYNNNVQEAIVQSYKKPVKPWIHWMYRNV